MFVKFKSGNDLVINSEESFGVLRFAGLGRELYKYEVDPETGTRTVTDELDKRVYDVKSRTQRTVVEINIDAEVPEIDLPYDTEVELVNVRVRTFASRGESIVRIDADGIVPKKKTGSTGKLDDLAKNGVTKEQQK